MIKDINDYNNFFYDEESSNATILLENKYLKDLYQRLNIDKRLCCDFGCGTGYWTKTLNDIGANVVGTDVSETLLNYCRQKYPSIKFYSIDKIIAFKFDFIFINWVLQEIIEIDEFKNVVDKLFLMSHNSTEILIVDNVYPDLTKAHRIRSDKYGEVFQYVDGTQRRFFSNQCLMSLFESYGFTQICLETFGESFFYRCKKGNNYA